VKEHAPRLLHTMLRVRDLERMLGFYCGVLGMHELRRIEFPAERRTIVFVGYDASGDAAQLEFWHDWDVTRPFAPDAAYGHLGIGVRDIETCCRALAARGVRVLREPAALRPGGRVIALIADPEGHEVELLAAD
jgi:lactoylglutathione lyase